jgi:hypothetical protein
MAFNNLPPQAYTRDTLVAAYEWLQSQPGSIREMAQNPNALVALYLQSKRRVAPPPATMPSTDAFKKDLQTLAEGLKQFEDPRAQIPVQTPVQQVAPPPVQQMTTPPQPLQQAAPAPQPVQQTPAPNGLDARTKQVLSETKERFNLSSEAEALRLLVALGHEKLLAALPQRKNES